MKHLNEYKKQYLTLHNKLFNEAYDYYSEVIDEKIQEAIENLETFVKITKVKNSAEKGAIQNICNNSGLIVAFQKEDDGYSYAIIKGWDTP